MNTYDIGDLVRCWADTFTNAAGADADPTTVVFKVQDPSGNETTYTYGVHAVVVKAATGKYRVDVSADEAGTWTYRWQGTGLVEAAGENQFYVLHSEF